MVKATCGASCHFAPWIAVPTVMREFHSNSIQSPARRVCCCSIWCLSYQLLFTFTTFLSTFALMPIRQWKLARRSLPYGERTLVMGVLNGTPDSFSDGGRFYSTENVVEHALQMIAEGADILDIGGESTRPGSFFVSEAEELQRVIPVIKCLQTETSIPISIDTTKASVARAALAAGVEIVNDISALRFDPAIADEVVKANA